MVKLKPYVYLLVLLTLAVFSKEGVSGPLVRGEVNEDKVVDIADPLNVLFHLFDGYPLSCLDAADADDSGDLAVADAVYILVFLFRGAADPRPPYPECGIDPTPDGLDCVSHDLCPAPENQPPTLFAVGDRSVMVEQVLPLTLEASDPDGDELIFSVTPLPLPENSSFDEFTGEFVFSPDATQAGAYQFTFTTDDRRGGNDSETVTITVLKESDPALVAAYGFEEGIGFVAADVSGNGNSGLLENGAIRNPAGFFGEALEFNGSTGNVNLGGLNVQGAGLTLMAWCNADDFGVHDARVITKSTDAFEYSHYWMLSTFKSSGIRLRFRLKTDFDDTTTLVSSGPTLTAGEWMHVAATYDGSSMRLYLNGVEVGRVAKIGAIVTNSEVPVWIGANPDNTLPFDGRIDEVRIYSRALNAAQIEQQMTTAVGDPLPDNEPPSAPTGVTAKAVSASRIDLSWEAATDDVGVLGYQILRDSGLVATTLETGFSDTSLGSATLYTYEIVAFDAGGNTAKSAAVSERTLGKQGPVIDIWYGSQQSFGTLGVAQPWFNVLGNVSSSKGVRSLGYSLNDLTGALMHPLSTGPDLYRLADEGDFNVDIPIDDLQTGNNTVLIRAEDDSGNVSTSAVTVNFQSDNLWPLPYTVDWNDVSEITEVAQVVDGLWKIHQDPIDGSFLRPVQVDYDRLVAMGDLLWEDYEVSVPITILGFDPDGFEPPSNRPGIGILVRWPGHSVSGHQPQRDVRPLGAIGFYRISADGNHRLELWHTGGIQGGPQRVLSLGIAYVFKMRVETVAGVGGRYGFKVWRLGEPEPSTWDMERQGDFNEPQQGSVVLVAHHVDATFGTVTIKPVGN